MGGASFAGQCGSFFRAYEDLKFFLSHLPKKMTDSEERALEQFRFASALLSEAYVRASNAGLDRALWEQYTVAREMISAAGHTLFRLSLKVRTGQPAELTPSNADADQREV